MVDHAALAAVMDEFAATVTGEFSSEDILCQLAQAATRVLDVAGVGVMAPADGELLRFVFATGTPVDAIERLQEEIGDGPCAEVNELRDVINIADLAVEGRWPAYQKRAAELGLRAVTALPLLARGELWGVLDIYRTSTVRLDAAELAAAHTLAHLATSYLVVTADRDAARDAQQELAYRAMHDPLTGLPVRWVFLEQLDQSLKRLQRSPGYVSVLFIDLDGLKYVNDTYGHSAGDRLITSCCARIRSALRPADVLARMGGDEFVVLLEEIGGPSNATLVAQRIIDRLAEPYQPDGETIRPSASVGVATTADHTDTADVLIAHADAAMYQAKHAGRGRFETFDLGLYTTGRQSLAARDELQRGLQLAGAQGELEVYYQPIVDLTDAVPRVDPEQGPPWAVEALVRWRHPERGLLTAGQFIDVAEQSGLIVEMGTWVLRTACAQLAAWDERSPTTSPSRIFVNVSVLELAQPALPALVADALATTGIAADRLTLEITETGFVSDPEPVSAAVATLSELGCDVAIDDFGVGYSSLSRLVRIPAAVLKVDQSFARDLLHNSEARAVVSAVLLLGDSLDRTVVVEGVEDAETLHALKELGVTYAQGFHLGLPLPAEQMDGLLAEPTGRGGGVSTP